MNLILLSKDDFTNSGRSVRISGRRHGHIREILKSSLGDELCVGLLGGKIGTGRVTAIDSKSVKMDVALKDDPPKPLNLKLILALPRPIVFKRLLPQLAALGVKKIMIVNSARVEKSYWKSPDLKKEAVEEKLILGLEQAKDTVMPEVSFHPNFRTFVEKELSDAIDGTRAILAHPGSGTPCPASMTGAVTLVIGPEGGFLPAEVEKLSDAGCLPVSFGERILRVETAVVAFIARLML